MKMMIEVSGGVVVSIVATQECSIYLVDHDNLKERSEGGADDLVADARQAMQPDVITWEEGQESTEQFDQLLDEALSPHRRERKMKMMKYETILQRAAKEILRLDVSGHDEYDRLYPPKDKNIQELRREMRAQMLENWDIRQVKVLADILPGCVRKTMRGKTLSASMVASVWYVEAED